MLVQYRRLNSKQLKALSRKEVLVFDLDSTLARSKTPLTKTMVRLLVRLLARKQVAVISGGAFSQFRKQIIQPLKAGGADFENLFLFPLTATSFYLYRGNRWQKQYEEKLGAAAKVKIIKALKGAAEAAGYQKPPRVYGRIIEDRGAQITFSALGQKAPLSAKTNWNKRNEELRQRIVLLAKKSLPDFEVHAGGLTSVDVTLKRANKAFGIKRISRQLGQPVAKMAYIGDAFYPNGNDRAVLKTGILSVWVSNPTETRELVKAVLRG